jgi:molybdenum cofactor biosynthesis enzyme MoaA
MKEIVHEHQTEIIFSDFDQFYKTKEYLEYRKLWNNNPVNKDPGKFPVNIDVSVTNHCNLRCTMCKRTVTLADKELWNSGKVMDPKLMFLDFEIFKKVIDEGVEKGLQAVHLTGHDGEPTMHKELPEMIKYARSKGLPDVFTHSNATYLHTKNKKDPSGKDLTDRLLDAQPHRIVFSVDSPVKETYEKIRVRGNYDQVVKNIQEFIKRKKERNLVFPIVKVQMVVMKQNKEELNLFKSLFKDELEADVLGFTEFLNYHNITEGSINGKDSGVGHVHKGVMNNHYICDYPYRRIRLDQSGFVYACLTGQYHKLGHAKFSTIEEMWHGKYMKELRENHIKFGACKTSGCEDCGRQWTAEKLIKPDLDIQEVEYGYRP